MKLACPGCPAKYTIPDERLDGRRVKVRCKRCGARFLVEPMAGGEGHVSPPPEPAARVDGEHSPGVDPDANHAPRVRAEHVSRADADADPNPDPDPGYASRADTEHVTRANAGHARRDHAGYTSHAEAEQTAGFEAGHASHTDRRASVRKGAERRGAGVDLFAGSAEREVRAGITSAGITSAPRIGERGETSVLFSLAALAAVAPTASCEPPNEEMETSALIDLRVLRARMGAEAAPSRADEIANLSGGGAFAALLAPPVVAFGVTDAPDAADASDSHRSNATRRTALAVGLGIIAVLGVVTFAGGRRAAQVLGYGMDAAASTPAVALGTRGTNPSISGAPIAIAIGAAHDSPTRESTLPESGLPESTPHAAPTSTSFTASTASAVATRPSSGVTGVLGSGANGTNGTRAHTPTMSDARTVPAPSAVPASGAKCCPGENETTCQMRIAVGASCAASASTSTTGTVPSFDRVAAIRALGVSVANCKRDDGPAGAGHAKVTFQPNGSASAVEVGAPYAGTAVGACIAQRFRAVTIPAFAGGPLTLGKTFVVP